jgi:hypothetical protein
MIFPIDCCHFLAGQVTFFPDFPRFGMKALEEDAFEKSHESLRGLGFRLAEIWDLTNFDQQQHDFSHKKPG